MLRTILFLIATLIALPVVSFYVDQPLSEMQFATLLKVTKIMLGVALTCFAVSEITELQPGGQTLEPAAHFVCLDFCGGSRL